MVRRFSVVVAGLALFASQLVFLSSAAAASGGGTYSAKLTGSHEVPANHSAGTGSARITVSPDGSTVYYQVFYSGLSGPATAAHIHLGAIGNKGPVTLPFAIGPSPLEGTLTAADLAASAGTTFDAVVAAIQSGGAYVNIHTATYPGGEIRGQIEDVSQPGSYTITADWAAANPAGHLWSFQDFFPRTVTVARGATVTFDFQGFHTATLLPQNVSVAQDQKANGIAQTIPNDPTVNANGTTPVLENGGALAPELPTQTCGTAADPCLFDGSSVVSTAVPLGPPTPAPVIKITAAPGTYIVHCRVHSAMIGSITVVSDIRDGASTPDDVAASINAQVGADVASGWLAEALANAWTSTVNALPGHTKHVILGYDAPGRHVSLLEMIPASVNAAAGDTVVWHPEGINEPHTVTFPKDLGTDVTKDFHFGGGNGVSTVSSPKTVSDSGLVTTRATNTALGIPQTASLHGWSVRFTNATAGRYTYVCQIHDGMAGVIVVK